MKHVVIRSEYRNEDIVGRVRIGEFKSNDEADNAIVEDVSDFRDHHDNDERVDWNIVETTDDIGNVSRFVWTIEKEQ